jgi:ferrous iron transport protein B
MGAIRREMNSARWTAFAIGYQCTLAYATSLMIYQFGRLFVGEGNALGVVAACLTLGLFLFALLRRPTQTLLPKAWLARLHKGAKTK